MPINQATPADTGVPAENPPGGADVIADAASVPMDDAAGRPDADRRQSAEEEIAAKLGDFA